MGDKNQFSSKRGRMLLLQAKVSFLECESCCSPASLLHSVQQYKVDNLIQHTAMTDSVNTNGRRPALIPKDATLGPDDIVSICTRTGHAMIPPPELESGQQAQSSQTDFIQAGLAEVQRGTKRKASTSNDRTYEPHSLSTFGCPNHGHRPISGGPF